MSSFKKFISFFLDAAKTRIELSPEFIGAPAKCIVLKTSKS
jgi:hypothetical protein